MPRRARSKQPKSVETITHEEASRRNLPSAEHQPLMREEEQSPIRLAYERRNRDLDPQLVWRGKEAQDASDLVVSAPPLYIQERVHPKALVDDLVRHSRNGREADGHQADMFADFNGLPSENAKTEFYRHDANWSNRMILGDSLQVMASLAEREGLRGKVQCIYVDPPYGIKFNSNFQWSTTSRDVRDGEGVAGLSGALVMPYDPEAPWPPFPRTVGNYWPYATTLFDYVRRAMPANAPGSLGANEVYAVVAWMLYRNEIVAADAVMDAQSLPAVEMPARRRFVQSDEAP